MNKQIPKAHLTNLFISLGMVPDGSPFPGSLSSSYRVILDGKIVGRIHGDDGRDFIEKVRYLKATGQEKV